MTSMDRLIFPLDGSPFLRFLNLVHWRETWNEDPEYWRNLEVAVRTGDFDSLVSARLSSIPFKGLP